MRHPRHLAVGLGVVLLVAGGVPALAESSALAGSIDADRAVPPQVENESSIAPNRTVAAISAVENRTDGTVTEIKLTARGDRDIETRTFVYEFVVVADDGTRLDADVDATNATVIGIESTEDGDGLLSEAEELLSEIFGDDESAPASDASRLRSAGDAVQIAVDERDAEPATLTVTEVTLESESDAPVYRVQLFEEGGERTEVLVAARGDEDFVTTDPKD